MAMAERSNLSGSVGDLTCASESWFVRAAGRQWHLSAHRVPPRSLGNVFIAGLVGTNSVTPRLLSIVGI